VRWLPFWLPPVQRPARARPGRGAVLGASALTGLEPTEGTKPRPVGRRSSRSWRSPTYTRARPRRVRRSVRDLYTAQIADNLTAVTRQPPVGISGRIGPDGPVPLQGGRDCVGYVGSGVKMLNCCGPGQGMSASYRECPETPSLTSDRARNGHASWPLCAPSSHPSCLIILSLSTHPVGERAMPTGSRWSTPPAERP